MHFLLFNIIQQNEKSIFDLNNQQVIIYILYGESN